MRSVETSERPGLCLHTRNVHGITCRDVDVHLMFGVPFKGNEIALGEKPSDNHVRAVCKLLQISFYSYPITMAEVQEVLVKQHETSMSNVQCASFKIAVVLFVVTHFFAPNSCSTDLQTQKF